MSIDNKNHRMLFIVLRFFVLIFIFLGMSTTTIYGASESYVMPSEAPPDDPSDLEHALQSAPRGLDIADPTFLQGVFTMKNSDKNMNSSKVILRHPNDISDKTGILRVTHGFNQLGSIWSNVDESNFLDVSQDQSMSMWLYFGRPINSESPGEVGDGMAFVLQNAKPDSSTLNPFGGINAISRFEGNPAPGETLGVWGADFKNGPSSLPMFDIPINLTAIQNSFAIEFDTFLNKLQKANDISGEGVSFDGDIMFARKTIQNIKGQHISMGYPDGTVNQFPDDDFNSDDTYVRADSNGVGGFKTFFKMNHKNLKDNVNLTDANWHHLTVKFEHATSTLSYAFNDKNLDGTPNDTSIRGSQKLDMNHFHLDGNKRLMWGFTGSTGKYMENNLIVFESIPSFVNADSSVSLVDTTKGNTIPGKDDKVNIGDDLDFVYDLDYKNGSKAWNKIFATMQLPSEVTFKSGSIQYEDDPDHLEDIPISEMHDGKVEHEILKDLSNDNHNAKIVLHTTVNNQTEPVNVSEQHAHFASDNFIVDDNTPKFTVSIPTMLLTTDPKGTINYSSMNAVPDLVPIKGTVKYSNNSSIDPSKVTLHYKVNNNPISSFNLSGGTSSVAQFDFDVLKSQLLIGSNAVKIFATDDNGQSTAQSTINMFIGGGLEFGHVSDNVSFEPVNVGYSGQVIPRQEGWQVEVVDGRGSGRSWTLQAKASELIDNKTKKELKGGIVYRNVSGHDLPLNEETSIYQNTKYSTGKQTIDITKDWTSNLGLFLKLTDHNTGGKYVGKITWTLSDGLVNK